VRHDCVAGSADDIVELVVGKSGDIDRFWQLLRFTHRWHLLSAFALIAQPTPLLKETAHVWP
jgi:hypothetical protein